MRSQKKTTDELFIEKMAEHFADVDPLTQVVVTSHLLLEERFNTILRNCVYNPEILNKVGFNFFQKMQLVRGFCISPLGQGIWEMLAAMNQLRNSIAHSLDSGDRKKRFEVVKQLHLRELEDPRHKAEDKIEPDHILFLKAFALCYGFLGRLEHDTATLGTFVSHMIKMKREGWKKDGVPISQP